MNDDIDSNYANVERLSLGREYLPFVENSIYHTKYNVKGFRDFVRLTRAFLAITDGGYFESKPALRSCSGIAILRGIRYLRDGKIVSMIFGESTVRTINLDIRKFSTFENVFSCDERGSYCESGRICDFKTFGSLVRTLFCGVVGSTKYDKISEDVVELFDLRRDMPFTDRVGQELGREFRKLIDKYSGARHEQGFSFLLECMFVDSDGNQIRDPTLLDAKADRQDKTSQFCTPRKNADIVSKLARFKADCLRVAEGFPPKTEKGIEIARGCAKSSDRLQEAMVALHRRWSNILLPVSP